MKKFNATAAAFALTAATGVQVHAQQKAPDLPDPTGANDFGVILSTIINGALVFAGAIAVLFLIIGGFRYVVSSGNPDQVEGAKKTILYAVLGLIIIFVAFLVVNFILKDILKVNNQDYIPQ